MGVAAKVGMMGAEMDITEIIGTANNTVFQAMHTKIGCDFKSLT